MQRPIRSQNPCQVVVAFDVVTCPKAQPRKTLDDPVDDTDDSSARRRKSHFAKGAKWEILVKPVGERLRGNKREAAKTRGPLQELDRTALDPFSYPLHSRIGNQQMTGEVMAQRLHLPVLTTPNRTWNTVRLKNVMAHLMGRRETTTRSSEIPIGYCHGPALGSMEKGPLGRPDPLHPPLDPESESTSNSFEIDRNTFFAPQRSRVMG